MVEFGVISCAWREPGTPKRFRHVRYALNNQIMHVSRLYPDAFDVALEAAGVLTANRATVSNSSGADLGYDLDHRRTDTVRFEDFGSDFSFRHQVGIRAVMLAAVKEYGRATGLVAAFDTGLTILRYGRGDFFRRHIDAFAGTRADERAVSGIVFLNTGYQGGLLRFPMQNLTVRPSHVGDAVFFPSGASHPHEVEAVEGGTRYTCVAWFSALRRHK